MNAKHWQALGLLAAALAAQIAGIKDWGEVTSPAFVAGALLSIGSVVRAIYSDSPSR